MWSHFSQVRFPHRDFTRDWNPGDSFCRCRSIKMGFYHHIGIDRVEFMFKKHVKRWVQFVDTVICVTNTTDYTEPSASDFAPKWFSHFWMTARMLPKQAHPGRLRRPGTGGFAARGGGHITQHAVSLCDVIMGYVTSSMHSHDKTNEHTLSYRCANNAIERCQSYVVCISVSLGFRQKPSDTALLSKVVPYHLVFGENQVIRICRPRRLYQGQFRAK